MRLSSFAIRSLGLAVCAPLILVCSFGQQRGVQSGPTTGGNTTGGSTTGGNTGAGGIGTTTTRPTIGQQPTQQIPLENRPIFLSGKVVLEDGSAPPDLVPVDLVCNGGNGRREGYTDSKGRFSFQLGQNNALFADASMSGMGDGGRGSSQNSMGQTSPGLGRSNGLGERSLLGCELRVTLAGFRADPINLGLRRTLDNPDLGTVLLKRLGNVEGLTISATSAYAPKDARKAYDKGRELLKKRKTDDAEKEFRKAVDSYPKYAAAWYELGLIQQERNQEEEARKDYGQAISADGKYVSPFRQLALMSVKQGNWQEVADTTSRVVRMNPVDFSDMFFYNALANYNLKNMDAAEKSAREAIKIDSEHRTPKASHLLGVILAQKEDYAGAAENMKAYLQFAPQAKDADMVRNQLAQVEKELGAKAENTADKPAAPPQ